MSQEREDSQEGPADTAMPAGAAATPESASAATPESAGIPATTPMAAAVPASAPAIDPAAFFKIAGDLPKLPTPTNTQSPLRKLGPSPFPKSGFPTLGFLETVYEHIESRAKTRSHGG